MSFEMYEIYQVGPAVQHTGPRTVTESRGGTVTSFEQRYLQHFYQIAEKYPKVDLDIYHRDLILATRQQRRCSHAAVDIRLHMHHWYITETWLACREIVGCMMNERCTTLSLRLLGKLRIWKAVSPEFGRQREGRSVAVAARLL